MVGGTQAAKTAILLGIARLMRVKWEGVGQERALQGESR